MRRVANRLVDSICHLGGRFEEMVPCQARSWLPVLPRYQHCRELVNMLILGDLMKRSLSR